jgi:hypothetical protein
MSQTRSRGGFKAAFIPMREAQRATAGEETQQTKKPAATTGATAGSISFEVPFQA